MIERRQFERVRINLQVRLIAKAMGDVNEFEFLTQNLSPGGVYIKGEESEYPFDNQTILEITLEIRFKGIDKISFIGKVVHNASGGFGIKVVQIDDVDKKSLVQFIQFVIDEKGDEVISSGV